MAVIRAMILGMATEDAQDDQKAADLVEILEAREDPADLGGQGYLVAREDLVVPVAQAAPEIAHLLCLAVTKALGPHVTPRDIVLGTLMFRSSQTLSIWTAGNKRCTRISKRRPGDQTTRPCTG